MKNRETKGWGSKVCPSGGGVYLCLLNALIVFALLVSVLPTRSALAQSTSPTFTFPECEHIEEELLLSELSRIARSTFWEEKDNLDIGEIVDRNWVKLDMDSVVDAAVDKAADRVLSEEKLWDRIISGWHPATAERFATKVITSTFESPEFKISVSDLSERIVRDLEVEMQVMTAISASSSLLCLQEFIGTTFSHTMAVHLENKIEEWLDDTVVDPDVDPDVSEILKHRTPTLAGVSLIIGTQIAKLLAKRVTQQIVGKVIARIVGKAAGSLIPVAGWIIGGALIVWDLVSLDKGSVPQIREALKRQDVKQEIRTQIAAVVEEELDATLPSLVEGVTLDMFGQWKRFLQSFDLVLRLAEKNARFRALLDSITSEQVGTLSELVALTTEVLGTDWLVRIIENGKFERILAFPPNSFEILRETASPDLVLDWGDFSGNEMVGVVKTGLYKIASPSDIDDRETLTQILAIEDPAAIRRLMQFNSETRIALLTLRTEQTKWLLTEVSDEDLGWTASYLAGLPGAANEKLVDFAIRDQELISVLRGSKELQSDIPGLLALANSNAKIQTLLDVSTSDKVHRLAELVAVASEAFDSDSLTTVIENGQFEEILALPRDAIVILRDSKDTSTVINWAALSGEALAQVVEIGLHVIATPSDFSGVDSLSRVLALKEPEPIGKLMQLNRKERDTLTELPTGQARVILKALSESELSWLARYLLEVEDNGRVLVAGFVIQKRESLAKLQYSENLRSNLPLALSLAEANPVFRTILNNSDVEGLEELSELVVVAISALGPGKLTGIIENGQFEQILSLPRGALEILKEEKDATVVLAWADLAGEEIEKVVETKLFLVASTTEFSGREALKKVLALENPAAIRKLMQMHQIERVVLLGLALAQARSVVTILSMEDLSWLALYLADLAADVKGPVVDFILRDQELIPLLKGRENLRTRLPRVLILALEVPRFGEILNRLSVGEVEKLAELVASADATMGPERIAQTIETGLFEELFHLPQVSFEILRVTGNPELVLEWAKLAGDTIAYVVETGLFMAASPSVFQGREELDQVIAIKDPVAIQRLMKLDREKRRRLLELPPEETRAALLSDLSKDELSWLAEYLPELPGAEQQLLVCHVVRAPILITLLENSEELKVNFRRASSLALVSRRFRQVFRNSPVGHMGKLTKLVAVAKESLEPVELEKLFETEDFERMFALPQSSFEILEWSKNSETIFAWAEIAEEAIVLVVERGLYRLAGPDQFKNRIELDRALNINDTVVLEWIFQLNPDDRSFLLTNLESEHIVWLAGFRSGFSDSETMQIARHIDQNQSLVYELAIDDVKRHLLESSILELDLAFVSSLAGKPRSFLPSMSMLKVAARAIAGDLSWPLYQYYYLVASLVLLSGLVVVLILIASSWWFLRRRHPE